MEWINAKEKLPEEGERVLTLDATNPNNFEYGLDYIVHMDERFGHEYEEYIWACRLYDDQNSVTHWMPLPNPPKENGMD